MALIACYECGKRISSDAAKCPHCGAASKKAKFAAWLYVLAGILTLISIYVING